MIKNLKWGGDIFEVKKTFKTYKNRRTEKGGKSNFCSKVILMLLIETYKCEVLLRRRKIAKSLTGSVYEGEVSQNKKLSFCDTFL